MYPATDVAFKTQSVTPGERHNMELWITRIAPQKRSFVRWIRNPRNKSIYIFVAA